MTKARRLLALAATMGALSAPTGCSERYGEVLPRELSRTTWDTLAVIGAPADSLLLMPRLLAAGPSGVYAFDYGDGSVKAFDGEGRLRWRHGRRGDGPGEFRNALDLEVAPDGAVWVVDGGTARVTVLDMDGTERTAFGVLGNLLPAQVVLLERDTFAVALAAGDHFFGRLGADGIIRETVNYPSDDLRRADPNGRYAVTGSGEGVWAAAFVFGDALLVYEGDALRCAGRLRDAEPLEPGARITDERPTVAAGVAVGEGRVWVFGIPRTERERRMVDEFDVASCGYLRSHELPVTARAFAYHAGIFHVQHEEPFPQILALRLRAP